MSHLVIKNLAGYYSSTGLKEKRGRYPGIGDCGLIEKTVDIAIKDEKIIAIEEGLSGDREFDGTGLWALPAWIDSHTHSLFAGARTHEYFLRWAGKSYIEIDKAGGGIHSTVSDTKKASDEELKTTLLRRLKNFANQGVLSVEVKTGYSETAQEELRLLRLLKSVTDEDKPGTPQIFRSFLALHALPKKQEEHKYIDSMIEILPTIKEEKLCDYVDAFPEEGFFSMHGSLRFAQEAGKLGIPCKIHCDEITDSKSSEYFISQGAYSIDHLQKINETGVALLANNPTVATLLPATSFYLGLPYAKARHLIDNGARVAIATDFNPGTAPSQDFGFTQLLSASQLKMSAAEIFCASTYNAAASLGLENKLGMLKPGFPAHINLFKTADIEDIFFNSIPCQHVFKGSQQIR